MAKPNLNNIQTSDTFGIWFEKTNTLVDLLKTDVVTASSVGDVTEGNAIITGYFMASDIFTSEDEEYFHEGNLDAIRFTDDLAEISTDNFNEGQMAIVQNGGIYSWESGDWVLNNFTVNALDVMEAEVTRNNLGLGSAALQDDERYINKTGDSMTGKLILEDELELNDPSATGFVTISESHDSFSGFSSPTTHFNISGSGISNDAGFIFSRYGNQYIGLKPSIGEISTSSSQLTVNNNLDVQGDLHATSAIRSNDIDIGGSTGNYNVSNTLYRSSAGTIAHYYDISQADEGIEWRSHSNGSSFNRRMTLDGSGNLSITGDLIPDAIQYNNFRIESGGSGRLDVRTENNDADYIFRVKSSGGAARFTVEHGVDELSGSANNGWQINGNSIAVTNGDYAGLRARSTTKDDVGLSNVRNEDIRDWGIGGNGQFSNTNYDNYFTNVGLQFGYHSTGAAPSDSPTGSQSSVLHMGNEWGRGQLAIVNSGSEMYWRGGSDNSWKEVTEYESGRNSGGVYARFSNRVQIAAGFGRSGDTVSFPANFSNSGSLRIVATAASTSGRIVTVNNRTNSSFDLNVFTSSGSSTSGTVCWYIAVGEY